MLIQNAFRHKLILGLSREKIQLLQQCRMADLVAERKVQTSKPQPYIALVATFTSVGELVHFCSSNILNFNIWFILLTVQLHASINKLELNLLHMNLRPN